MADPTQFWSAIFMFCSEHGRRQAAISSSVCVYVRMLAHMCVCCSHMFTCLHTYVCVYLPVNVYAVLEIRRKWWMGNFCSSYHHFVADTFSFALSQAKLRLNIRRAMHTYVHEARRVLSNLFTTTPLVPLKCAVLTKLLL